MILATGIKPRKLGIEGLEEGFASQKVLTYLQVLRDKIEVGKNVAIIGAGGIGFDVATYLSEKSLINDPEAWLKNWGVDKHYQNNGALLDKKDVPKHNPERNITLIQRKTTKVGKGLGKTSGWVHRANLVKQGVNMVAGASYKAITEKGLVIEVDGKEQLLEVDTIIICAGQESNRDLQQALIDGGLPVHLIGGANVASELDAKRAIRQAAELAVQI